MLKKHISFLNEQLVSEQFSPIEEKLGKDFSTLSDLAHTSTDRYFDTFVKNILKSSELIYKHDEYQKYEKELNNILMKHLIFPLLELLTNLLTQPKYPHLQHNREDFTEAFNMLFKFMRRQGEKSPQMIPPRIYLKYTFQYLAYTIERCEGLAKQRKLPSYTQEPEIRRKLNLNIIDTYCNSLNSIEMHPAIMWQVFNVLCGAFHSLGVFIADINEEEVRSNNTIDHSQLFLQIVNSSLSVEINCRKLLEACPNFPIGFLPPPHERFALLSTLSFRVDAFLEARLPIKKYKNLPRQHQQLTASLAIIMSQHGTDPRLQHTATTRLIARSDPSNIPLILSLQEGNTQLLETYARNMTDTFLLFRDYMQIAQLRLKLPCETPRRDIVKLTDIFKKVMHAYRTLFSSSEVYAHYFDNFTEEVLNLHSKIHARFKSYKDPYIQHKLNTCREYCLNEKSLIKQATPSKKLTSLSTYLKKPPLSRANHLTREERAAIEADLLSAEEVETKKRVSELVKMKESSTRTRKASSFTPPPTTASNPSSGSSSGSSSSSSKTSTKDTRATSISCEFSATFHEIETRKASKHEKLVALKALEIRILAVAQTGTSLSQDQLQDQLHTLAKCKSEIVNLKIILIPEDISHLAQSKKEFLHAANEANSVILWVENSITEPKLKAELRLGISMTIDHIEKKLAELSKEHEKITCQIQEIKGEWQKAKKTVKHGDSQNPSPRSLERQERLTELTRRSKQYADLLDHGGKAVNQIKTTYIAIATK